MRRDRRERDAEHGRRDDADQDRPGALVPRQSGGRESDHDRIVPGQNQIDYDYLKKGLQDRGREDLTHALAHPLRRREPVASGDAGRRPCRAPIRRKRGTGTIRNGPQA